MCHIVARLEFLENERKFGIQKQSIISHVAPKLKGQEKAHRICDTLHLVPIDVAFLLIALHHRFDFCVVGLVDLLTIIMGC